MFHRYEDSPSRISIRIILHVSEEFLQNYSIVAISGENDFFTKLIFRVKTAFPVATTCIMDLWPTMHLPSLSSMLRAAGAGQSRPWGNRWPTNPARYRWSRLEHEAFCSFGYSYRIQRQLFPSVFSFALSSPTSRYLLSCSLQVIAVITWQRDIVFRLTLYLLFCFMPCLHFDLRMLIRMRAQNAKA